MRALERRSQWRPGNAMLSWLFSIMHSIWLNELRSVQRLVMRLVAVEGMSCRKAADVLCVPIGPVMGRLSRARSTIGERFLADATAQSQGGQTHAGG